jgi:hypothetical protein
MPTLLLDDFILIIFVAKNAYIAFVYKSNISPCVWILLAKEPQLYLAKIFAPKCYFGNDVSFPMTSPDLPLQLK